jgi:hypothetical protein
MAAHDSTALVRERAAATVPQGHELASCGPLVVTVKHGSTVTVDRLDAHAGAPVSGAVLVVSFYTHVIRLGGWPTGSKAHAWRPSPYFLDRPGGALQMRCLGGSTAWLFPFVSSVVEPLPSTGSEPLSQSALAALLPLLELDDPADWPAGEN